MTLIDITRWLEIEATYDYSIGINLLFTIIPFGDFCGWTIIIQ